MELDFWMNKIQDRTELKSVVQSVLFCLVMSFHVNFDKQVHKKTEKKKIKQAKKLKARTLLNQTRTEKQTPAAALRHTIYFFLAKRNCSFALGHDAHLVLFPDSIHF